MAVNRRNPDTFFLCGLLLLSGIGILLSGASPDSVNSLVHPTVALIWAWALTLGALFTVVGAIWGDSTKALIAEATGRLLLSPASIFYAVIVLDVAGKNGRITAALLFGLALTGGWRVGQIAVTLYERRREARNAR